MAKLLLISFDAVGDHLLPWLAQKPAIASFMHSAATVRDVDSIYLSNTYPVHASVVTGRPPCVHGLISNTQPFPQKYPQWCVEAEQIHAKTLWQAAADCGLRTASVLWPVTGGARSITYNLPEIMPRPGDNQVMLNLKYGSKAMQIRLWLRYRHLLQGIRQPARDRFAAHCMADIIRRHRPDLMLMHFTCVDSLCHEHGEDRGRLAPALDMLDEGLALLLDAVDDDTSVIVFSDHAQLQVHTSICLNELLVSRGLLIKTRNEAEILHANDESVKCANRSKRSETVELYRPGAHGCFFECCGGSAFFHPGDLLTAPEGGEIMRRLRAEIAKSEGFARFLRQDEMDVCGRAGLAFGICAKPGYSYEVTDTCEKGQHGYPLDYHPYQVFYMVRGRGVQAGQQLQGGSLLDIAPIALQLLAEPGRAKNPCIQGLAAARSDLFDRQ